MHGSRHLEKMHPRSKFKEGAAPLEKRPTRFDYDVNDDEQEHVELAPFWEKEEQTV